MFWSYVKDVLAFIFVLGLAYYALRLLGKRTVGSARHKAVRVMSGQSLGTGKSLHVVVVGEKTVLLLGVGTNVECVGRFDDPELAAQVLMDAGPAAMTRRVSWLRRGSVPLFARSKEGDFNRVLGDLLQDVRGRRSEALVDERPDLAATAYARGSDNAVRTYGSRPHNSDADRRRDG
jgi:flagellar protein FliO/FliZ